MKLYCATTNPGKLREFRFAAAAGFEIEPLPGLKDIPAPVEDGATFEENAILKAAYYGIRFDGIVLGEDSGLEVSALDGAPGVWSARFAGEGATDDDNNRLLIARLQGTENRAARYVSVIAMVEAGAVVTTVRGEAAGRIIDQPHGSGGFGYDPYFFYPPLQQTFAEITAEQKFTVGHRGEALRLLFRFLAARSAAR